MLNKEPEPAIFNVEYLDPVKGSPVKEKVDFVLFRNEMDRKNRTLVALASRSGPAFAKMQSMPEEQLLGMLEKNIRDAQTMHKILGALDDFFKLVMDKEDRDKVKGIKPELAIMKNAIVKANQKRHEFSAQKEEEEQMKKLGISVETVDINVGSDI
jgi:predicted metalloendopeptidase